MIILYKEIKVLYYYQKMWVNLLFYIFYIVILDLKCLKPFKQYEKFANYAKILLIILQTFNYIINLFIYFFWPIIYVKLKIALNIYYIDKLIIRIKSNFKLDFIFSIIIIYLILNKNLVKIINVNLLKNLYLLKKSLNKIIFYI